MASARQTKEILKDALNLAFRRAKIAQLFFVGFQLLLFVFSFLGTFLPDVASSLTYPVALLIILVVTIFLVYIADSCKNDAENLLRHHEYWDAYDQRPPPELVPDLAVKAKGRLSAKTQARFNKGLVFASAEPPGDRRCLENLRQSAWFTS